MAMVCISVNDISKLPFIEVTKDVFYSQLFYCKGVPDLDHCPVVDSSQVRNWADYGPIVGSAFKTKRERKVMGYTKNSATGAASNYFLSLN